MLVLKNWKYGLKKLIMFDTMQNCIMFWPMHWLFSTAWGSVELDLEAGFVCPFVHWPCQFRRENSGFPGLLLDHPQALMATSAWILGIYLGFPFEFVGFFFQENGVFPLVGKKIVTLAKNPVKNTRFFLGKQLRSGILQYSYERLHVWVCLPASLATFVL